jgi:hypothetical protein
VSGNSVEYGRRSLLFQSPKSIRFVDGLGGAVLRSAGGCQCMPSAVPQKSALLCWGATR